MSRAVSLDRPFSLTRRLMLLLTLGGIALWLAGALASGLVLRHELDEAFDGGLRETAERLLPLALDTLDDRDADDDRLRVTEEDALGNEYVVYQLRDRDGRVLLRSADAPDRAFAVPLQNEAFATADAYRVFTLAGSGGLYLHVAERQAHRVGTLLTVITALLLPLLALIPLAALGILLIVRRSLRPVARLRDEVADRHAARLAPLETAGLPTELLPIAQAVNGLLARLRDTLGAERAFAANAAHEIRTPIAGSLAQVQRLIAELDDGPPRQRAKTLAEALTRLGALAEKLLQLSRADAGMALSAATDLLPALDLLADDGVALDIAAGAELVAPIDVDAFGIVMRNLIDNAQRHGSGTVTVRVPRRNVIEVENAAPAVAPAVLATLTRRFERGSARTPGTGLGLAIVATILQQVGGRLELVSPIPGRSDGFLVRMRLADADHSTATTL